MNKLTQSIAFLCTLFGVVAPATAALNPGAKAPAIITPAVIAGKPFTFNLAAALKKGPVVLYFYPAAFTSGCTVEAHEFAEATADFAKAGATVIGISNDKIETLTRFSVEACRNKFAVAVATPEIIKAYDTRLPLMAMSNRTSYVIAPNGQVVYTHSALDYRGHVSGTLKAVRDWQAAKR